MTRARGVLIPLVFMMLVAGCARVSPDGPAGLWPDRPIATPPTLDPPVSRSPPASPASPAPVAPPVTCPSSGVRVELAGRDAAMGLRVLDLALVNCGRKPFPVRGYPAVQDLSTVEVRVLEGVAGVSGAFPGWVGPPEAFVLEPGARAAAVVVWRNTYDDIRNPPVTLPYLEVAPAAGLPAQVVDPGSGLDLGSTGRLAVSPWKRP